MISSCKNNTLAKFALAYSLFYLLLKYESSPLIDEERKNAYTYSHTFPGLYVLTCECNKHNSENVNYEAEAKYFFTMYLRSQVFQGIECIPMCVGCTGGLYRCSFFDINLIFRFRDDGK